MRKVNILVIGAIIIVLFGTLSAIGNQESAGAILRIDSKILVWVELYPGTDLDLLKGEIEAKGGKVVTLAPEDKLLLSMPQEKIKALKLVEGIKSVKPAIKIRDSVKCDIVDEKRMGARKPTHEELAFIEKEFTRVFRIQPNALSLKRSKLQGLSGLPALVDNSLSQYFPPIRSQGSLGCCACFSTAYYYNTYTQAKDEDLNVSGGNNDHICSPAFLYNLHNCGENVGMTLGVIGRLNQVGCCSWSLMPYDGVDYTTWPTEAAWIDAFKRRTLKSYIMETDATERKATLKQVLANGNIAVGGTHVYSNWYDHYPDDYSGINSAVLFSHEGATYVGSHAMAVIGYDDNKLYYDDYGTTQTGAFLIANSWGSYWGTYNSSEAGSRGFMWVAYDYFGTEDVFEKVYFNEDRDAYRSQLYAATGLNHNERGRLIHKGGIGTPGSPDWQSYYSIYKDGGNSLGIDDSKRVVVDLTEGLSTILDYSDISLFVRCTVDDEASSSGTLTSAEFFHDFDGDQSFQSISSSEPPLIIDPDETEYATVNFFYDGLMITPMEQFSSSGWEGSPFSPPSKTYALTNNSTGTLSWSAVGLQSWLDVSPTSGILTPSSSTNPSASINANANSLSMGIYPGTVMFTNTTSGFSQDRDVELTVYGSALLPFFEDFESGVIQPHWFITGTNDYHTEVSTEGMPFAGNYHIVMDDSVPDDIYSRNEATLTINLEGYKNVNLIFWVKAGVIANPDGPPPIPFTGGADFDGVAISEDGNTWYEVLGLRDLPSYTYVQRTVDLDAAKATYGLSFNSAFKIRFNQYDNWEAYPDGMMLDNIEISGDVIPAGIEDWFMY